MFSKYLEPYRACIEHTVKGGMAWRDACRHSVRHVRFIHPCLMGALLAVGGGMAHSSALRAQTPSVPGRLSVRPREMALGQRTVQEGKQILDSAKGTWIYVPQQCVGTRRCPLLLSVGYDAGDNYLFAKQYGFILLSTQGGGPALVMIDPGLPDLVRETANDTDMRTIDDAMKQVLQNYAIDIDRIAVTGGSNGGSLALFVGLNNSDIFSRIVPFSAAYPNFDGIRLQKTNAQLILSAGTGEPNGFLTGVFEVGIRARNDGYPVMQFLRLTGHAHDLEEDAMIWRLLYESWTTSDSVRRTVRHTVAQPLLTVESVNRFAQFWASFMKEPDSIRTVARRKHQKCFIVPVGTQKVVLGMTDMIAMAAKYPSIAASLKAAGLTAKQAEASRLALISAKSTAEQPKDMIGSVAATSVLGKNAAFFKTHSDQLQVFETLNMWSIP